LAGFHSAFAMTSASVALVDVAGARSMEGPASVRVASQARRSTAV
jgi:hypothetical protein